MPITEGNLELDPEQYAKGNPTWLEDEHPRDEGGEFSLKNAPKAGKKLDFDPAGGTQQTLFQTAGEKGQMNIFADRGVPDELLTKDQREKRRLEEEAAAETAAPDVLRELSDQEKSEQEFAQNFNDVSADPPSAKSRNLHRARSFLHGEIAHLGRKVQRGELDRVKYDGMVDGLNRELDWYSQILKERGDYAGGGPYSDETHHPAEKKPVKTKSDQRRLLIDQATGGKSKQKSLFRKQRYGLGQNWSDEDERKHPRDHGKFSSNPGQPGAPHHSGPKDHGDMTDEDFAGKWNSVLKDPRSASNKDLAHAIHFAGHLRSHHANSENLSHEQRATITDSIDGHVAKLQGLMQARKAADVQPKASRGDDRASSSDQSIAPGTADRPQPATDDPRRAPSGGDGITQRHAAASKNVELSPAPIKSLLESMLPLRDVRKHGSVQTKELGHDYAKQMYEHLQKPQDDGFGEVHDLSEELGHGAMGYASPAGNLVMIPPKFKTDDWDVRFTLPDPSQGEGGEESGDESPETTGIDSETGGEAIPLETIPKVSQNYPDTPQEPIQADFSPPKVGPGYGSTKKPKPKGVNPKSKIGQVIVEAVGDDPEHQEAFSKLVDEIHNRKQHEISSRNSQLRELLGAFGYEGHDGGAFVRAVQKYDDSDQFMKQSKLGKKFDQMVDFAQNYTPELLKFEAAGSEAFTDDPEYALFERLKTGLEKVPAKHSDEILDEALSFMQSMEKAASHHDERMASDPEYAEWAQQLEATPFGRRGIKIRYQFLARRLSLWRKYAKQLSLFKEDEHPRAKEAVSIEGTDFTPGEWIPKDAAEDATAKQQEKIEVVDNDTGEATPLDEKTPAKKPGKDWETLGYDKFRAEYQSHFKEMMKYGPNEVGSQIFADKMAEMSEAMPEWAEKAEEESGEDSLDKTKQPWQLTRGDWHSQERGKEGYDVSTANRTHKHAVSDALETGADVPPEAYRDYPDLAEMASNRVTQPVTPPEPPQQTLALVEAQQKLFDAGIMDTAPTEEQKAKATVEVAVDDSIRDFGEKIGGARKDLSGGKAPAKKIDKEDDESDDDREAWRKRYEVIVSSEGKFHIFDTKKEGRYGGFRLAVHQTFDTREQAEEHIPLVAVARNHRVGNLGNEKAPNYAIFRQVTERKRPVIKDGFASYDDAMRHMVTHAKEIIEHKTRIDDSIHPALEEVVREGTEHRPDDRKAKPDEFQKTFGFRGVEFGNWNNQAERQHILNHAYDSMMDLSTVLNLFPKAISLNGDLALGFGSRGHGLTGARAHYERDYGAINLTKVKGAGALAHEWMHSLDHLLGRKSGKASSEKQTNSHGDTVYKVSGDPSGDYPSHGFGYKAKNLRPELKEAYDGLMDVIQHRTMKYTEDESLHERIHKKRSEELGKHLDSLKVEFKKDYSKEQWTRYKGKRALPAGPEVLKEVDELSAKILSGEVGDDVDVGDPPSRGRFWMATKMPSNIARLSELHKQLRGNRGFSKEQNGSLRGPIAEVHAYSKNKKISDQKLAEAQDKKVKEKKVKTDFYSHAERMDLGTAKDYWKQPHELLARAFESYVYDKIKADNGRNDFLAYEKHNELPIYKFLKVKPFPEGEERENINAAFDRLLDTLKPSDFGLEESGKST